MTAAVWQEDVNFLKYKVRRVSEVRGLPNSLSLSLQMVAPLHPLSYLLQRTNKILCAFCEP